MKSLFTRSFFRFLFGFLTIIAISFITITVVGYIADEENNNAPIAAEVDK